MIINRLDHLVLTVADIGKTCAFYADVMGMTVAAFAGDRKALHFGGQKINLHRAGHEFEPKAARPGRARPISASSPTRRSPMSSPNSTPAASSSSKVPSRATGRGGA